MLRHSDQTRLKSELALVHLATYTTGECNPPERTLHIKRMGVLVENFEKSPQAVRSSRFVGVAFIL